MGRLEPKLKEILKKRGMTQHQLAKETGIRPALISEMASGQRSVINKAQAITVMDHLGLTSLDDLFQYIPDTDKD